MVPYGYHWWLGSSVVLCQVWICFTAPWWEKSKLRWDCLPWVSLLISGVWYYPKKCHLLPVSSILLMPVILCFQQHFLPICPSCLSSSLSCSFWFLGHLLCATTPILVSSFGGRIAHVLMWHIREWSCHHSGTKYTMWFVPFSRTFIFRFRASCPDEYIYNLLLSILDTYMLERGIIQ